MSKRVGILVVVSAALIGCSVWVPVQTLGPEPSLRVRLAGDSTADLHDTRVSGDSVSGMIYTRDGLTRRITFPLADVKSASARRLSRGRTTVLAVTAVTITSLIIVAIQNPPTTYTY